MARRGFMLGALWAFIALAFVGGVVVGAVLPLWQRAALQNDVRVLEKRLADKQKAADDAQAKVEDLQERVASLETSTEELTALNSQLTSEVATLRAAQTQPPASTGTTGKTTGEAGSATIVERTVSPATVTAGGAVTLQVKTRGAVDKVTMRIDGPSGSSYDYTFSLKKVATEGDVSVWRSVLKAPPGAGQYRCIASAIRGSSRTTASAIPLTVN